MQAAIAELPPDETRPAATDDIRIFLGSISDEEYAVRSRLRTARNAASWRVTSAESPNARALLWMCAEKALEWVYAPAPLEFLAQVAEHCRRLLALAEQAENLDLG